MSIVFNSKRSALFSSLFTCMVFIFLVAPSYADAQASSAKMIYTRDQLETMINNAIVALRGDGTGAYRGYVNNLTGSDTEARRHGLDALAAALTPLIQNAKDLAVALEQFKKTPLPINDEEKQADIAKRLGEIQKKAAETQKAVAAVLKAIDAEKKKIGAFDFFTGPTLDAKRMEIISAQSFLVGQIKALDNMINGSIDVPMPKPKPPVKPEPPAVDELPKPKPEEEEPPKSPFKPAEEPSEPEPVEVPPMTIAMPMPKTEREAQAALKALNEMIKELEKRLDELMKKGKK